MSQAVLGPEVLYNESATRSVAGTRRLAGLMIEFDNEPALRAAVEQVRQQGFTRWDVHTPYPVHGLDTAMGVRMTILPVIVFIGGVVGCLTGIFLTHYTAAVELYNNWWVPTNLSGYAIVASGKPLMSTPAFIPPIFELTILFSALTCVFGMLILNNLPTFSSPLLSNARFRQVTTDKFFIVVDAKDAKFDTTSTAAFLREMGGSEPMRLEHKVAHANPPRWFLAAGVVLTCLALIPLAAIAKARNSTSREPRIHIIQDMDNQEKYKGQMANPAFLDNRAMRPEPQGTVARGDLRKIQADVHFTEGLVMGSAGAPGAPASNGSPGAPGSPSLSPNWATTFPRRVEITPALLERGQDRFNIYCAPCHGIDGRGGGPVAARNQEGRPGWETWVTPLSLHDATVRERQHGHIFNTISNGIRTMPPYSAAIAIEDRWAIVTYVRALQRSSAGTLADVPADVRTELEAR